MQIIKFKSLKNGKRLLTVEVDDGEVLVSVHKQLYYKLGYPVENVVHSDVLIGAYAVSWCSSSQEWVS